MRRWRRTRDGGCRLPALRAPGRRVGITLRADDPREPPGFSRAEPRAPPAPSAGFHVRASRLPAFSAAPRRREPPGRRDARIRRANFRDPRTVS